MQIGFSIGLTRSMMRYGIIHIGNAKNIFHLAVQINMVFRISPNSISAKKKVENIGVLFSPICVMRNTANVVNTNILIATAMIVNGNLIFLLLS